MSSIPSADAKAVVKAVEGLTTQLRRAVTALTTPVVEDAETTDDAPPTTNDDALRYRLARVRDAAALHRKDLIGTHELYAVIEAGADDDRPPHVPDHTDGEHCPACEWETAAPAADEDQTLRWTRRESLLVLLTRLQRGRTLTEEEAATLRHHVETEIREADSARTRAGQAEEILRVAHATSNQSEAARAEEERLRLALAAERDRWKTRAEEVQAAIERVREVAQWLRRNFPGLGQVRARLADALDGTEQPTDTAPHCVPGPYDDCPNCPHDTAEQPTTKGN